MRRRIMIANWKMHKTATEAVEFITRIAPVAAAARCLVIIAPPFPSLSAVAAAVQGSAETSAHGLAVAGQNLHWESEGAFTGEVSGPMLAASGCAYAIVGHSERRQYFGETDETVHRKVRASLAAKLTPIVCVGETQAQRDENETEIVLRYQFERAFWGMEESDFRGCVLAYEPVWAIGTGKVATPDIAEGTQRFLRHCARNVFGSEAAETLTILYGGSVTPANVRGLLEQPDVDGALVGSASLDASSFAALIRAC
ncbi:MAG TPA: triose-phosphate isomerase [Terriglobales bacterium]|nr:triose-phosphate isomerase [Terriglobales bacterium]